MERVANAANNCTPLTPGCSNVPTAQQVKQFVQQQCLSQFNNSGAGGSSISGVCDLRLSVPID